MTQPGQVFQGLGSTKYGSAATQIRCDFVPSLGHTGGISQAEHFQGFGMEGSERLSVYLNILRPKEDHTVICIFLAMSFWNHAYEINEWCQT